MTRVDRDAQGKRATFDEIEVGADLGEIEWTVDEAAIDTQCRLDSDYDAWYSLESPWGARVAPPQTTYRPPRWLLSRRYNVRGLLYKWQLENVRPIQAGTVVSVKGWIKDKYVKNEREFVVVAAEGRDAGGVVFRTERTHLLDVLDRATPRAGEGVDSGIKPERI